MSKQISFSISRPLAFVAAVGVIALAIVAAPALGGAPRSVLAADPTPGEHVISVSGTGKITVKPVVADVSVGVQTQSGTAKAARDDAANVMNAVLAALHNLGITDDNIQTSSLNINPVYDYNSSSPRIVGYQVTNIVSVHVTDITKVADVIDNSVAAGATTVNYVTFDVADRAAAENQARDAAVKDARSHADALAAAAGVTITGVASISETTYSTPYPWYGVADASGAGKPGAPTVPTPVVPGTQDITITVSASYTI
jgi:uncharacterized protein YggE